MVTLPTYISGHSNDPLGSSWASGLMDFWLMRLLVNVLGYMTLIGPVALLVYYLKKTRYNERAGHGFMANAVRLFVYGNEEDEATLAEEGQVNPDTTTQSVQRTTLQNSLLLVFCFFGLQGSYLTWGLLQERIMAREYGGTTNSPGVRFKNSQFLVFMNRILAFVVACVVILLTRQPRHKAPLYRYSYSSFSNIMSSWFQYEALKYVSFPTQVLAKASKIIPVMLMGKVVSKKTYDWHEYLTAILISAGVSMFLLTSTENKGTNTVTTFSGFLLLIGYMLFDSFTSNWQGELFNQYKMSSIQMMAGVNLFSVLLTSVSLFEQHGFFDSVAFMGRYPVFSLHVTVLSICSATGQLFIFFTISQFGPVTFVIIMTIRQAFAILLSCLIYHHALTIIGLSGVLIVFFAMFLRIYFNYKKKQLTKVNKPTLNSSQKV
ncbi:adenosine 3'-phospho 5'-phosphosulfate transporter 1-like isoform X2 [Tubulanus polymorphus]